MTGTAEPSNCRNAPTNRGAEVSTEVKENCGFTKPKDACGLGATRAGAMYSVTVVTSGVGATYLITGSGASSDTGVASDEDEAVAAEVAASTKSVCVAMIATRMWLWWAALASAMRIENCS